MAPFRGIALVRGSEGIPRIYTDDFEKWPFDPPLSTAGLEGAFQTGLKVRELAEDSNCQVHIIITSPYYRCIQTAVD